MFSMFQKPRQVPVTIPVRAIREISRISDYRHREFAAEELREELLEELESSQSCILGHFFRKPRAIPLQTIRKFEKFFPVANNTGVMPPIVEGVRLNLRLVPTQFWRGGTRKRKRKKTKKRTKKRTKTKTKTNLRYKINRAKTRRKSK